MPAAVLEPEAVTLSPAGALFPQPRKFVQVMDESAQTTTIRAFVPKPMRISGRVSKIQFGVVHDPRLKMKRPVSLEISRKQGTVIAYSRQLDEFGCGETMSDALDDFSKGLAELYFELRSQADRLGKDLLKLKDKVEFL